MSGFDGLEEKLLANKYNAENAFYHSLEAVSSIATIETATMPIVALLEHQVISSNIAMNEMDIINRGLNPNFCDTHESLARHLDYRTLNTIHAIPGSTTVTLSLSVEEIYDNGYVLDNGSRRVVIPEDTIIGYKDDMLFGIHHAIQITMFDNETIDISYIDNDNPLKSIDNPVIESRYQEVVDTANSYTSRMIEVTIDVYQFKRTDYSYAITPSLGFEKTYTVDGQYYHARVFTRTTGSWTELDTYFSEYVYNAYSLKAATVVSLEGSSLKVHIPQIYFSRGLIGTEVKVVIYSTLGDVDEDFQYSMAPDWYVNFQSNDSSYDLLVAPLESFRSLYVHGTGKLLGGVDILSVDTLRTRVLAPDDGAVPITKVKLRERLAELDYRLVQEHNYVGDSLYVASKRIADVTINNSNIMVAGGGLDLLISDLTDVHGVISNGDNYTITPDMIARIDNGIVSLLTNDEVSALTALSIKDQVATFNSNSYLATPFHYLVERMDYNQQVTAFDMSDVMVVNRTFVGSNGSSNGLISTRDFTLSVTDSGYALTLTAVTNDTFLENDDDSFIPQLTVSDAIGNLYSLNGELVMRGDEGEFLYEFNLDSTFDLGQSGVITLANLIAGSGAGYTSKLEDVFALTYNLVIDGTVVADSTFKEYTDPSKLPSNYRVMTLEKLTLRFGVMLESIYTPTTTYAGTPVLQTYEEDVVARWPNDVYETDSNGHMVFTPNPNYVEGGTEKPLLYNKLHSQGDIIYESDGITEVLAHRAGQVVTDAYGVTQTIGRLDHQLQTKLVFLDYKYRLVESVFDEIKAGILYNIDEDILPLEETMLGLTELRYSIGTSIGDVKVRYDSSSTGTINSGLSFSITAIIDEVGYVDSVLKSLITTQIREVISDYVGSSVFAINALTAALDEVIGDSVEGFSVTSINGSSDIINFTLLTEGDVVGVRPKLVLGVDNKIKLEPDVTVIFKLA